MKQLCLFVLLLSSICTEAQNLTPFKSKSYAHAGVGLCVLDLHSDKPVVSYNADQLLTPASILKILTTGAALELLGPEYKVKTRLMYSGEIRDHVLHGNLIVLGSGDPGLGSRQLPADQESFLKDWTDAVLKAGIRKIEGRIIANTSVFDDEGVSPFWLWEDIGNYYATGSYGLNVFDNSFELELSSGAAGTRPEIKTTTPLVPGLTIDNHLLAAPNDQDSAYLYGAPFQMEMRLFGSMPANRARFTIRGQLPDPPAYLAGRFKNELEKNGVEVTGAACTTRSSDCPSTSVPAGVLFETPSMPLLSYVGIILKKSDNFYTECLLKMLAAHYSDEPASVRAGLSLVKNFWKKRGLDMSALVQYDACGLSPNDRVTAGFIAEALKYMGTKSAVGSVFENALPLAGREGSVASFLRDTPLEAKLRLKSGSNQVVNSYAGFYRRPGKEYVVVAIVNHASASRMQIRKDIETFLRSL